MTERISTKVTKLKSSVWGCRVLIDGKPTIEVRVKDRADMLRTIDKLGFDSNMAHASRHRENHQPTNKNKFIWL
jgi:hypothetical protein